MALWQRLISSNREDKAHRKKVMDVYNGAVDRSVGLISEGWIELKNDFSLRFELVIFFVSVHLYELLLPDSGDQERAKALWDMTFEGLEHSLREQGVSDIRVAGKMRKLHGYATGRRNAYLQGLESEDPQQLREAIARNVLNGAPADDPRVDKLLAAIAKPDPNG